MLIAAGERLDQRADRRGFYADLIDIFSGCAGDGAPVDKRTLCELLQRRQNGVVTDGEAKAETVLFAILGKVTDAGLDRIDGIVDFHGLTLD
ncbi:hypothetical protein SDC9_164661 [bioreactor metagenome]|uniref:Uncharacterized protein n=1 Tax=bioreactor metagenome TaxID=1076179 RepID=A0A645FS73_9ZZZZ